MIRCLYKIATWGDVEILKKKVGKYHVEIFKFATTSQVKGRKSNITKNNDGCIL